MLKIITGRTDKRELYVQIDGHAGAGEPGKDPVCSAATFMMTGLAQRVRDAYAAGWLAYLPTIKLEDGQGKVRCKPRQVYDSTIAEWFGFVSRSYELLASNYPDFVRWESR